MSTKQKTNWFKTTVEVTAKHIEKSSALRFKPRDENCPVALALRGLRLRNVSVEEDLAEVSKGNKLYVAELPKAAQNFIKKFDRILHAGDKLKPITFRLKFVHNAEEV